MYSIKCTTVELNQRVIYTINIIPPETQSLSSAVTLKPGSFERNLLPLPTENT